MPRRPALVVAVRHDSDLSVPLMYRNTVLEIEDVGRSGKLLTLVLLELLLDLAFSSRVRGARASAKDERVVLNN